MKITPDDYFRREFCYVNWSLFGSAKCKAQSAKWRNCVAIILPPSDEGGGKILDFDGGRDRLPVN